METIVIYFLKVSVLAGIFYLAYHYMLRRETFHLLGRTYLLASLLLSLMIPLLSLKVDHVVPGFRSVMLPGVLVGGGQENVSENDGFFTMAQWLFMVYAAGVVFILARLSLSLFKLYGIALRGRMLMVDGIPVIITDVPVMPFSFVRWVFMDQSTWDTEQRVVVLRHEKAHIDQLHSLDILFAELLKAIFWFNPVVWWYKRSLAEVHEYLADHTVISSEGIDIPVYLGYLYDQASLGSPVLMTSHFNHSLLKRRFIMLTQVKSGRRSALKISFILPLIVIFGLFIVNAFQRTAVAQEKKAYDKKAPARQEAGKTGDQQEVYTVVEVMPEYPGGHEAMSKYIAGNVKYPLSAKKLGIQSEVYVQFVVDQAGKIRDVKSIKEKLIGDVPKTVSKDEVSKNMTLMKEEAIRVVASLPGTWKPGMEKNKKVAVSFTMPIKFKLDDKKK